MDCKKDKNLAACACTLRALPTQRRMLRLRELPPAHARAAGLRL